MFDEKTDEYAKVLSLQGGKHLTAQLLDSSKDKIVSAVIKGSHHRKIWYTKDDYIIVRPFENLYEVQGKVPDDYVKTIQNKFDKLDKKSNTSYIFEDDKPEDNMENTQQKINANSIDDAFDFNDI